MSQETNNIEIDPSGDLLIKVTEYEHDLSYFGRSDLELPIARIAFMKVRREILRENSPPWKAMLDKTGPWQESTERIVELKDDTVVSIELCLRVLHKAMTEEMNSIPIEQIWHALEVCRKYFLNVEMLYDWFAAWWAKQNKELLTITDLTQLIYPTQELDHAGAFAYVTHSLVYKKVGHIVEENPTHHRHLHLRHSVIQQLNAARGSLRAKLHRGIFDIIKNFLAANCACKEKALFAYCTGLDRTHIWPLEEYGSQKSITELVTGLSNFRYNAPAESCANCKSDRGWLINIVRTTTMQNFDGLCLDCMDISYRQAGNLDNAYWKHSHKREWDESCRVNHGQPTWYFSFMGRKVEMDAHKEMQRARQRGH